MRRGMEYNPRYYQMREFQLERMLAIVRANQDAKPGGVVFFGDSLTEFCDVERWYPGIGAYNCGIGGGTSQELLWMVDEGVVKYRPRAVVIMVGTNDMGNTLMGSPKDIAFNIREIVEMILGCLPACRVLVCSPTPCIERLEGRASGKDVLRSNDLLGRVLPQCRDMIRDERVAFVDVTPAFFDESGRQREELYREGDGLHINDEGYRALSGVVRPALIELLAKTDLD